MDSQDSFQNDSRSSSGPEFVFDPPTRSYESVEPSPPLFLTLQECDTVKPETSRGIEVGHSSYGDYSDFELVVALGDRQKDAFTEVFRRYQSSVVSCSRMIVGHGTECDDVTADVFIGLWLDPSKFDPTRGSLLSYLRMQAKGRSIDLIRAESTRARRERNVGRRNQCDDNEIGSITLAREASSQLRQAVSILPATEREPIELAYFGGMTYTQAALVLGVAEGTLKSRVRRGLERLRVSFESESRATAKGPQSSKVQIS